MSQTVSVRIKKQNEKRAREIANFIPGCSISAIVDRALEQWLDVEGPVYIEAFRQVKENLKRQPVAMALVARD